MPEHQDQPRTSPAMGPCPFAMAAMTVPARRWSTRSDLMAQLAKADEYLNSCPLEGFRVADAAASAGLSRYHFLRLFKEVYGKTPFQLVVGRRIESAKELLRSTDLGVLEIAAEAGFTNGSAFARRFKHSVGLSPSAYRIAI